MKTLAFVITFLLLISGTVAQESLCPEPSKKAKKLFDEAQESYNKQNPELAYKLLLQCIAEDPEFARPYLILADVNIQKYHQTNNMTQALQFKNRAVDYYIKCANACPAIDNYRANFEVAYYLYQDKKYTQALPFIDKYLAHAKNDPNMEEAKRMKKYIDSYNYLISHPVPFNPKKVEGICTNDDEFLPLITPDNEEMFYTHRYNKTGETGIQQKIDEFTIANRIPSDSLKEIFEKNRPMLLPFNANANNNQGAVTITIDNNHLYVTICDVPNCDIWVSDNEDGTWSPLRNLGGAINGRRSWESQPSISSDGKMLFFASIRPGNIGFEMENDATQTSDIWMSRQDENGNWLPAVNLGPIINTPGNEKSPFIHSDSQTLYFSSDGLDGMGGYDIYYSKMLPDGKWSEPKNIGYPINTENDEIGFIVSTNGKKAYFSSNKLSDAKGWDIYSFDLYNEARPKEVVFYKGQVKDEKGEPLQDAKVIVKDINNQRSAEAMVNKMTGKYAVVIPIDKPDDDFILTVKKKDYAFSSSYIKAEELKKEKPVEVDFEVKPIEVGTTVKINNIYFATNQAVFEKSSLIVLDNFLEFLNENPNVYIEIEGHTDNEGDLTSNQILSEKRAKAVAEYLILNGLDKKRIVATHGYGETKPVATNDTPEGRALNRRTEFTIVKK